MKNILSLILLLPLSVLAQLPDTIPNKYDSLIPEINGIIKNTNAVGLSIAIIENYQLVWARGFGLIEQGKADSVTSQTLFQAASITKSLTATTIMKKIEEGKLSLTGDVNAHLISWKIPDNKFAKLSPVNLKQLMSHTSGIITGSFLPYTIHDSLPSILQVLNGKTPAHNMPVIVSFTPGKMYSYTGAGYVIMELLLMDLEKKTFEDIISHEIFTPLKMNNSTFAYSLPNVQFPSVASGHLKKNKVIDGGYYITYPLSFGGLWSTPSDLAKFLSEIQLSVKENSGHILSQKNARMMVTPVSYSYHTAGGQYALGFTLEKRGPVTFFGHNGHNYGYISSMLGSLDGGYGIVIMTNSENGYKAINQIEKLVGRKYWHLGKPLF